MNLTKQVFSVRMADMNLEEALDYYGHGRGFFWDLRTMAFIYLDSHQDPHEWVAVQASRRSGDVILVNIRKRGWLENLSLIRKAMKNPGQWIYGPWTGD